MSPRIARRTILTSVLVLLAVSIGGAASAYWSGSGSGAASGTSGTAQAVTLTPGTPTADLYPGGVTNVVLTMSNPNAYAIHIGSLALDPGRGSGGFSVDGAHPGCDVSPKTTPLVPSLSFTTNTTGWTVPASSTLSVTLIEALMMAEGAKTECQGAIFTVYLAAIP